MDIQINMPEEAANHHIYAMKPVPRSEMIASIDEQAPPTMETGMEELAVASLALGGVIAAAGIVHYARNHRAKRANR